MLAFTRSETSHVLRSFRSTTVETDSEWAHTIYFRSLFSFIEEVVRLTGFVHDVFIFGVVYALSLQGVSVRASMLGIFSGIGGSGFYRTPTPEGAFVPITLKGFA